MGTGDKHRKNSYDGVQETSSSVNELTRQAHKRLQKGDLHGALEHYEQAVREAKSNRDPTVKISSYLNAGACLVSLGHYRRGLELLESACRILKKIGVTTVAIKEEAVELAHHDHITAGGSPSRSSLKHRDSHLFEMSADVHYNAAVAAQGLQDFEKAAAGFEICIDHYLKARAKKHAAEGFSALAGCCREAGRLDKEIVSFESAQQLYAELEDFGSEAMTCLDLAKLYFRVGRKEECKKMVATAKLQAMRVDNPKILGKLHSQFGLLYTSLGSFEEAIRNFEKALPLVRSGVRSANSLQVEASLLQNIGAAYNELGRFFDAVVYHREAAVLHGRTKNLISESKCLCNLAFAQAQLKDYPEASKNFSNALAKAHKTRNNYLQFQACEGLGAINYHMGKYGETVSYFRQALGILDEIKQETGIPRERVMEKLSDAEEALQLMKAKQRQREFGTFQRQLQDSGGGSLLMGTPGSSSDDGGNSQENGRGTSHLKTVNRRLSPEFERVSGEGAGVGRTDAAEKRPSLTERRGVTFLPPIETQNSKSSKKHAIVRKRNNEKSNGDHHLPPLSEGRDNGSSRERTQLKMQDSLDAEVQDYISSYKDREEDTHSSSDSDTSQVHNSQSADFKRARNTEDRRVFSRHAQRTNEQFSGSPDSLKGSGSSPRFQPVAEGCLALGPNARELYTTQTRVVKVGRKKRTVVDIVPKTPASVNSEVDQSPPSSNPQPQQNARTSTQSKICVIL